jgi:response regulator RpfG family c-di-GMP phosphodiesterase
VHYNGAMIDRQSELRQLLSTPSGMAGTDPTTGRPRVLLVDDEPAVLSGIHRNLRSYFSFTTAETGPAALELLDAGGEFAVVVSDMQMPLMDGVTLLRAVRERAPDAVRILLTGYADLASAMAAVNEGHVFRFLTKPANADTLRRALDDGIAQYRLVQAERELLEGTLRGAVGALLETLSLASPAAFSRAVRIRTIASELLDVVSLENRWEIEIAAMLSQVGAVTLTPEVVSKLHRGARLTDAEAATVARLPELAADLLRGIPRLEGVREIIVGQRTWTKAGTPLGSRLLQLASDIEELETKGIGFDTIYASLRAQARDYGEDLMAAVLQVRRTEGTAGPLVEVGLDDLEVGMVLGGDVNTTEGALLVGRGQAVSESLLRRLHNFAESGALTQETFFVVAGDGAG